MRDVATGQERQLTTDGVKDFGYATSNAGWTTSAARVAVVVAGRQEDRDAAAGRAEGRRHVPRRDAGQRRPPGASRVEVSAPGRSGRRDDHPRHHRRGDGQGHEAADGAGFPPRDVRRQHRHGRVPLEPGRHAPRFRLDRSVSQELHRQARRHDDRRSEDAVHRDGEDARADARAVADPLGDQRGAVVLAARRHRADVSLRSQDRPAQEPDHQRCRADHAHRPARSRHAHDVVRRRRQGEGTGSVLHAPLQGRARRQEHRLADAGQRHAHHPDLARRQVRRSTRSRSRTSRRRRRCATARPAR